MSMYRSPAAALWLLAAVGAYGAGAAWADDAQTGKLHPWVLIALFWGVALVSVAFHHLLLHLAQASIALKRNWLESAGRRARLLRRASIHLAQLANEALRLALLHVARGRRAATSSWPLLVQGMGLRSPRLGATRGRGAPGAGCSDRLVEIRAQGPAGVSGPGARCDR
jgi:hypothetical protein